jgi:class 3 adenylate cyclase/tetratricopeptide (TPR) repeat protein
MQCAACQAPIRSGARFCGACGAAIRAGVACAACDAQNPAGARFCSECGAALGRATPVGDRGELPPAIASAERRQITVLSCDLVDSTALSARLDPEEMREVIVAYQACAAPLIRRFAGLVARYVGDGILAYFGYPQAQEDAAERAVRAGLALLQAVAGLQTVAGLPGTLQVRVGLASGLVVVGRMPDPSTGQEHSAVGDTPNLAARLQALAGPGQVVVDPATRRQLGDLFACEVLGPQALKGLPAPVPAWRVVEEGAAGSRFEALRAPHLAPLVGRDEELALLLRRCRQVYEGQGRVVLIAGEPGIGKSRLLAELETHLAGEPVTRMRYFCSPHAADTPLCPVVRQLETAAGFGREDAPATRAGKLRALLQAGGASAEDVALVTALLHLPDDGMLPLAALSPQRRKERTFAALLGMVEQLSAAGSVLMLVEDLQWADPSTCELLDHLIQRIGEIRVLLAITYRPEFQAPWVGHAGVTAITLSRLERGEAAVLAGHVATRLPLQDALLDRIVAQSDGVPLFIEELTKAVIESGLLIDRGDHYAAAGPIPSLAIPATLHGSLLARLDRLAPVREIAQSGAALGRQFSHELISAVAAMPQPQVDGALAQLVDAELIYRRGVPPDAEYTFKHALVQDAAYQSMLKSRRVHLHARIADVLERSFPERVEAEPETLGRHLAAAALAQRAIPYWLTAGRRALQRSAMKEAIGALSAGIGLLAEVRDETARMELEFELQYALGLTCAAAKGYAAPEVEAAFSRAHALCPRIARTAALTPAVRGLWRFHWVRGNLLAAKALVLQLLQDADTTSDDELSMVTHGMLGGLLCYLGELSESKAHFEIAHRLCTPQRHLSAALTFGEDVASRSRSYHAFALAYLGHVDIALAAARDAVALAHRTGHSLSVTGALVLAAFCSAILGDRLTASSFAEEAITRAKDHGFTYWETRAKIILGWASARQAGARAGVSEIREGIVSYRSMGAEIALPFFFGLLSETELAAGDPSAAANAANEGLRLVEKNSEHVQDGFLLYSGGDAMVALGDHTQAEGDYYRAMAWSRERNAKWVELNAGIRLARLWQTDGRADRARDLLAPLCGWFTEGLNNPILRDANALLQDLTGT